MAALSPQLVDAIVAGKHSPVLTLVGVTDDLPLDWAQQSLSKQSPESSAPLILNTPEWAPAGAGGVLRTPAPMN
jgi:hypothetical protein